MKAQKVGFWIWSDLQTSGDVKNRVSEFGLKKAVVLR